MLALYAPAAAPARVALPYSARLLSPRHAAAAAALDAMLPIL